MILLIELMEPFVPQKLFEYAYAIPGTLCETISLTAEEANIFAKIISVLKEKEKSTVCRVAGGWVRDKLLGRESDDIDIAIDDMSGQELVALLSSTHSPMSIKENCNDKTKHLETATIVLFNRELDIVNLRKERYKDNSRVPEISIGTPIEDAERRDVTMNCLYYNINDNKVEDFLGNGIEDMKNGLLRTPKPAAISFKEDPLRMLRVIRFATRFQYRLDKDITAALEQEGLKEMLISVASRQRLNKEFNLMLERANPQCAIYLLHKSGLLEAVAQSPFPSDTSVNLCEYYHKGVNMSLCASYVAKVLNVKMTPTEQTTLYYALLSLPFQSFTKKEKKEVVNGCKAFARDSFILPTDAISDIMAISDNIEQLKQIAIKSLPCRLEIGMFIRRAKAKYLDRITISAISLEYVEAIRSLSENKSEIIESINDEVFTPIISKYKALIAFVTAESLESIGSMKPLLDGKEIQKLLGLTNGKQIGFYLEELIKKQIETPHLTIDQAKDFLINTKKHY